MSTNVSPIQTLAIFGLLARHGECAQAELMPALTKDDREALEKAGLISVKKVGRAFALTLSDAGWDWAGAHLSAELPSAHSALHEVLGRLQEYCAREKETLAGFIGGKPGKTADSRAKPPRRTSPAGESPTKPTAPSKRKPSSKRKSSMTNSTRTSKTAAAKAPSATALRKRIEAAYLSLTGGLKNESVRLARLRTAMPDLDRAMIDAALGRILKGDKKASLMRHDDPGQLDASDHAAAFNPAGEPFHVIWIAS